MDILSGPLMCQNVVQLNRATFTVYHPRATFLKSLCKEYRVICGTTVKSDDMEQYNIISSENQHESHQRPTKQSTVVFICRCLDDILVLKYGASL